MTREESIEQLEESVQIMRRQRKYNWLLLLLFPPFGIIALGMVLMGLLSHGRKNNV
jgi:hypothetical protein